MDNGKCDICGMPLRRQYFTMYKGKEAVRICPKCKKMWNRLVLERKEK